MGWLTSRAGSRSGRVQCQSAADEEDGHSEGLPGAVSAGCALERHDDAVDSLGPGVRDGVAGKVDDLVEVVEDEVGDGNDVRLFDVLSGSSLPLA